MLVTSAVDSTHESAGGLRPLDPTRDLGQLAELIGEAFRDEMDQQGRAAIRELRWMARMSPLVWWLAEADPGFRETYNGFVWEEPVPERPNQRVLVGNASLSRAPGNRHRWVISNVVVARQYRRKGIARRLMATTIAEARRQGADGVVLQVFQHNWPALHLYTDLGFERVAGETELRAEQVQPPTPVDAAGYDLRPWRPVDGRAAFELAQRAIPAPQRWLRPLRPADYQPDWLSRAGRGLESFLARRRTYRILAWPQAGGDLAALLTLEMVLGQGEHRLGLLVDPAHRDRVETALISRALRLLAGAPPRPVRAQMSADHSAGLQALGEAGFRERRTLLTLSYVFKQERETAYGRLA